MDKNFVQTNGDYVKIGGMLVKTNSPLNTHEFKQFRWRDQQLMTIMNSGGSNATDELVEGAWALIRDYPQRANGYQAIMAAMEHYEIEGNPAKARLLANQLIAFSMPDSHIRATPTLRPDCQPEQFKLWAKGFLNRLDSFDKPVAMQFTAVDGREIDLSKMKEKVVLVDFWATTCGPCVAELPRIKAAYDKFHAHGFEVIGISCDTDKNELEDYVQKHDIPWPQYFDGKQQDDNKFAAGFGIDGIPHMFLVDKKGLLRLDNVRASDKYHAKGDTTGFEEKISELLAEP